jgi:hypothetical protein
MVDDRETSGGTLAARKGTRMNTQLGFDGIGCKFDFLRVLLMPPPPLLLLLLLLPLQSEKKPAGVTRRRSKLARPRSRHRGLMM